MRSLAAVLVLFLAAVPFPGFAQTVNFLTEENPPLNFSVDGKPAGMATQVVVEMAARAKVPADIKVLPWSEAYSRAQLESDTCVYSTARLTSRNNAFQWVGPLVRGYWSAFALEGFAERIAKVDDLKALRVGVVRDARAEQLRSQGFTKLMELDRDLEFPAKLSLDRAQAGSVDIWVTQGHNARQVAKQQGVAVKEVFSALMSQDYWLACSREMPRETVRAFSAALNDMRRDGTLRKMSEPPKPAN